MTPPSFGMLEEQVNKLFTKDHVQGKLKFKSTTEVKEETSVKEAMEENVLSHLKFMPSDEKKKDKPQRMVFKTDVTHDLDTKEMLCAFIVKYHFPKHGVCLSERWDTGNTLSSKIIWKGLAPNLTFKFHNKFAAVTKESTSQLKVEYGNENYKVNATMCPSANELEMSGVALLNDWYLGAKVKTSLLTDSDVNSAFCLGRRNKFYNFHCSVDNMSNFGTSVFIKAHKNLQLGVRLGWQNDNQISTFAIATKYNVHDNLSIAAKVDDQSKLDISAIHKISPDVKIILSAGLQSNSDGVNSSCFGAGLVYKPQ